MYARITNYRFDPDRADELSAKLDDIAKQVKQLPGVIDAYTAWRDDGNGIVTAFYESKEQADSASSQVQAIWGSMSDVLAGPPEVETYDSVNHLTG